MSSLVSLFFLNLYMYIYGGSGLYIYTCMYINISDIHILFILNGRNFVNHTSWSVKGKKERKKII